MTSEYVPTGHPSRHGFVQCYVCETWCRVENTKQQVLDGALVCKDTAWCLARVRKEK